MNSRSEKHTKERAKAATEKAKAALKEAAAAAERPLPTLQVGDRTYGAGLTWGVVGYDGKHEPEIENADLTANLHLVEPDGTSWVVGFRLKGSSITVQSVWANFGAEGQSRASHALRRLGLPAMRSLLLDVLHDERFVPEWVRWADPTDSAQAVMAKRWLSAVMDEPRPGRRGRPVLFFAQLAEQAAEQAASGVRGYVDRLAEARHESRNTTAANLMRCRRLGLLTDDHKITTKARKVLDGIG